MGRIYSIYTYIKMGILVDGFGSSASNISLGSSAASNAAQSQQQEPQQADDSAGNKQLGEENDSDLIFEDCTPERLQVQG